MRRQGAGSEVGGDAVMRRPLPDYCAVDVLQARGAHVRSVDVTVLVIAPRSLSAAPRPSQRSGEEDRVSCALPFGPRGCDPRQRR